jgi:hypothetical protein
LYTSNTIWHQVNAVTTAIVLPKGLSGSDNWKVGVLARAHTRRGTGRPVSAKEDHWICSDWLWLVVRDRAGVKYNTVTKVGKYARSDQCKHQNLVFHAADWTLDLGLVSCSQIPLTVKTQPLDSSPSWRHFLFPISVVQSVSQCQNYYNTPFVTKCSSDANHACLLHLLVAGFQTSSKEDSSFSTQSS